jgi:hypothetical protein
MGEEADGNFALFAPIGPYVAELATARELPALAIGLCTLRYPESGPLLRPLLARAADGEITSEHDARQIFRGLFIIGGRRDPLAFEPLLRLLRRPNEELEWLLGDAITEDLARIVTGVFDGNSDALFDAIVDLRLDEFVRDALFGAATFLTWEGRIERERMVLFLERFDRERLAPDGDFAWVSWMKAVALLGRRDLVPTAMLAWDRGAIPDDFMSREEFAADLDRAEQTPDDIARFEDFHLGYIADVLEALEKFPAYEDEWDEAREPLPTLPAPFMGGPVTNPWRHVGRNDPCPCGSGKKAKRCCLAT